VLSDLLSVVVKFDTVANDFIPEKNDFFLVVTHLLVKGNGFFGEVNKYLRGNTNKLPVPTAFFPLLFFGYLV